MKLWTLARPRRLRHLTRMELRKNVSSLTETLITSLVNMYVHGSWSAIYTTVALRMLVLLKLGRGQMMHILQTIGQLTSFGHFTDQDIQIAPH